MDKINIKRGHFLKLIREESGYTERDLAEIMGVEPSDITVWETGIKFPDDSYTIEKLSKVLNVTKKELLNGEFNKNKKDQDIYEDIDTDSYRYEGDESSISIRKSVLLVGLACIVLFILIIAVASLTNNRLSNEEIDYSVSDVREKVVHKPRTSNEQVIYKTNALAPNVEKNNTDNLLKYGFTKVNNSYVKATNAYRIEYYDDTFHMTIYKKNKNYYFTENINEGLIVKETVSFGNVPMIIKMDQPKGIQDCDVTECRFDADYYRYLTFLIKAIRG